MDYIAGTLDNIGFVCIEAKHEGKWVMSYHKRRGSWECPGGHVEPGEAPLAAAKRELFEETGALDFDIVPVWDYALYNDDGTLHNNGRVYFAEIRSFAPLDGRFEMSDIGFFDEIPEKVTYNRDNMISMMERAEKCARVFCE